MRDRSIRLYLLGLFPVVALSLAMILICGGEDAVTEFFRSMNKEHGWLRPIMVWLTRHGNIPFYAALLCIAFWPSGGGGWKRGLRFVAAYGAVLILLLMATDTLKIWIGRPRPDGPGEYALLSLDRMKHSFPSNHIVETTLVTLSLARRIAAPAATLVCGGWLAMVGLTRMYLGRHHPTDLIGSALLGALAVIALFAIAGNGKADSADMASEQAAD